MELTRRNTKTSPINRRAKNLQATQSLLGHSNLEYTVRYLSIEVQRLNNW
jgi:site-specific recombinase XerC